MMSPDLRHGDDGTSTASPPNNSANTGSSTMSCTSNKGEKDEPNNLGCGILGRYPIISMLLFAAVGIAVGIGFNYWTPSTEEELSQKITALQWIGLVGDLFIRALKCVVLPLVFINVSISVVDMMFIGKASSVGWKTIGMYLLTTVIASIFGIISIVLFLPLFQASDGEAVSADGPALITIACDSSETGSFLAHHPDGSVSCTSNATSDQDVFFLLNDVNNTFVTASSSSGPVNDMSLSDTIYQGVFLKIFTENIFESFVDGNFAAVVFFAIIFGVALAKHMMSSPSDDNGGKPGGSAVSLLKDLDAIFMQMIYWIIMVTPFAVLSLIANAIGSQDDLINQFANVGFLVLAACAAFFMHFVAVDIGLFSALTRSNPFTYLRHIIPAQTMAFASASSAATIPVSLRCVAATGRVSESVGRFVIPLGATVNMDGGAIYITVSCVWLAVLNGFTPNIGQYVLLVILATVGSAGAAPVPSASLVLIITAYNTVFNQVGTPAGFSFILAIDWFVDRLRTTLNVTGDTVVAGIVSATSHMEEEGLDRALASEGNRLPSIFEAGPDRDSASGAVQQTSPTKNGVDCV